MATIQRIDGERSAAALAELLNGNGRRRPVVVVTTPAGRTEPWVDIEQVAREAADLADVYLMPTGRATWEFSHRMAEGTQVYGGAARVYPVGHEWASNLSTSPLRFAFDARDGERVTHQLISDTLRMAAASGLHHQPPKRQLRQVTGTVTGVVAGRALVNVGNTFPAAIAEELTVEDVRIDRIVTAGQQITGWYDAATNRVDIAKHLRGADQALAAYAVGDVILTKVAMVDDGAAELVIYPKTSAAAVVTTVQRADVSTNPADDLQTLMTPGEVIPARVVQRSPRWALILNDIDDDEPVVPAPSLLDGGPPWLVEDVDDVEDDHPQQLPPAPKAPQPAPTPAPDQAPAAAVPSPALFDRNRARPAAPTPRRGPPKPTAPPSQPSESTRALLLKIETLSTKVKSLERDLDAVRTQLDAAADQSQTLKYLCDQAERRANRAENELKSARSRLRKAGNTKTVATPSDGPQFADAEQGFRYQVLTQWATRTLPGEQHERPLPDFRIGPRFLDSLSRLEGIKEQKVADVVFEILTGIAPQNPLQPRQSNRA